MPQFRLHGAASSDFRQLDAFTRAYVEAFFFTEEEGFNETYCAQGIEPLGQGSHYSAGFEDLAPKTLASIVADCAAFQSAHAATLASVDETGQHGDTYAMAGHDFWLTRNGHGAGFWDGDWPESCADALTEASKAFGECSPYVGDDGKVYA